MLVHLSEIRESGPFRVEAALAEKDLSFGNEVAQLAGPVSFEARVSVTGERVEVSGAVKARLHLTCCRCLKRFSSSVGKRFNLEYWPDPVTEEGEEHALEYEDLEVGFYRDDLLDLSGVVCEQIVLEIPMKPVCRSDCLGLCDQCGSDLNQGDCGCDRSVSDPRLAALAELKKKYN